MSTQEYELVWKQAGINGQPLLDQYDASDGDRYYHIHKASRVDKTTVFFLKMIDSKRENSTADFLAVVATRNEAMALAEQWQNMDVVWSADTDDFVLVSK